MTTARFTAHIRDGDVMVYRTGTIRRMCDSCGRLGLATFEEDDQSGQTTRWIEASGSFVVTDDGQLKCVCQPDPPARS